MTQAMVEKKTCFGIYRSSLAIAIATFAAPKNVVWEKVGGQHYEQYDHLVSAVCNRKSCKKG